MIENQFRIATYPCKLKARDRIHSRPPINNASRLHNTLAWHKLKLPPDDVATEDREGTPNHTTDLVRTAPGRQCSKMPRALNGMASDVSIFLIFDGT